MRRALGIDLGTTHSLVAFVDDRNRARVLDLDGGGPLLPSAVRYAAGGVEVGAGARDAAASAPGEVVLSVKRLMGDGARRLGVGAAGPAGQAGIYGREVTPIEVSAEILRALRARAEAAFGAAELGGCVVTVPAYFDDAQRAATRDAARIAGLELLRLVAEPTAAALAFGLDARREGTFAVYDLGGGTFDLSILRLEGGVFHVLSTAGDTRLGGDDLDAALAARLGLPGDPATLLAARAIREALTARDAWEGVLPGGARARVSRAELEEAIAPVVARTLGPARRALADAGLEASALDGVVLVGGATRTPLVRREVRALFGRAPLTDVDPDTAVALGAAIQADALERGGRDDLLLLDVVPLALGVETMGGVVEPIVPRNSTIPARATQEFTTHADGQTGIVVHVVQGERELAADCRSVARFTLRGIPPMPAGAARVEIAYDVDADGILHVTARERTTGVAQEVHVRPTSGLTEEEVERMLVESVLRAEDDVEARALAEGRLEAAQVLAALEAGLREDAATLEPGEREVIVQRMAGVRAATEGTDPYALRAWLSSLDEAAKGFAERRASAHLARAFQGKTVEEI
jgi:molecular chaperone HscA